MQNPPDLRHGKPREYRRRTVLPARLRSSVGWSDACILNISSRGLMIYAKCELQPGSRVELRRGGYLVFAQVVWRKDRRIGLFSQDELPVDDIITSKTAAAVPAIGPSTKLERRKQPREPERSRAWGRAVEFVSVVLAGTALAGAAGAYVLETLATPMVTIETALRLR